MTDRIGISGRIARLFLDSELTPLLGITALLLGLFAVAVTPREEEPQINVTMANVIVPFPGASAEHVESLVTTPMEKVLAEISGVKHIYSVSRPGVAVITVQFEVGEERTDAIVRLYNAIYSNQDWRPAGTGILQPLVKPKGIDDVPVLSLTLWTRDEQRGAHELRQVAHAIEAEIKRVPGTRNVYTIGGPDETVHVALDPQRLAGYGLTVNELIGSLQAANVVQHAGATVADGASVPVQAGEFLADRDEVAQLVVAVHEGRPVYLQDVAEVRAGPDQPEQYVRFGAGPAAAQKGVELAGMAPAVTIAVSKKPGENAIDVTRAVLERVELLRGTYIPDGVELTVTRDYGETANDKAQKLIQKLMLATASVVLLVWLAVGWREAVVVGAAVVITLAATLFASWAWGFTINRVSLFALIFAIGILVDDAIVVVENIHRHMGLLPGASLGELIPRAVDEVGGPTILATFTVIAALLPMAFVSGLMGPYMSPIPINASMGMLISLAIALTFTPWLSKRLLTHAHAAHGGEGGDSRLQRFFERIMAPFLRGDDARPHRRRLYLGTFAAIALAVSLVVVQWVVMKMLPLDNKSEFQVVVDMPEGAALEETGRVLDELATAIAALPEVTDYQVYAGTSAPINFNGLVRQYYLRAGPELGDIQVNLVDKHHRDQKSHEIAVAVRPALAEIGKRHGASVKVVEVPPGPPVQAPLVAEIYGPSAEVQRELTRVVRRVFDATPDVVDVDDSLEPGRARQIVTIDRQKAALLGVNQAEAVQVLATGLGGFDATFLHAGRETYPIPVRLELDVPDKADLAGVLALQVRSRSGARVPLSEIAVVEERPWDAAIYHKDLLPLSWVTADAVGDLDSPLYGMFSIVGALGDALPEGTEIEQRYFSAPEDPYRTTLKWDGEWQITYETFRDMGLAYSVGLVLIYLLVVAQFRSYAVPLVIMAPIPLTV
ncbi:MAG: efflux RND transporter permease subunit, partial [Steroidobacteraceae bacterium]|nr:efflux RND transporter permease subunit [Steroidobacteraceae bacterium]